MKKADVIGLAIGDENDRLSAANALHNAIERVEQRITALEVSIHDLRLRVGDLIAVKDAIQQEDND